MAVWRCTGRRPEELDTPELPGALQPLWRIYLQLDAGRGSTGFGMAAIGWQDIAGWQRITGSPLTEWEAETLIRIDRAVRAVLDAD